VRVQYTASTARTLSRLPDSVRKALYKQVAFLVEDLGPPSLRAKKYDEARDLRQARVNRDWRFYFRMEGDTYVIADVIAHPK
jgi:mRNA-degrading endonuclease RelE of RelBE toxin-antitoxin system